MSAHASTLRILDDHRRREADRVPCATREEFEPTFKQLHDKHPDAVMMWFARGRLWASQEEARAAEHRGGAERRKADWRPGGEHRDPRARYDIPRDEKRRRFAEKQRRESRGGFDGPPRGDSRGEGPPPDDRRDQFKPREDRPPGRQEGRDRSQGRGRPRDARNGSPAVSVAINESRGRRGRTRIADPGRPARTGKPATVPGDPNLIGSRSLPGGAGRDSAIGRAAGIGHTVTGHMRRRPRSSDRPSVATGHAAATGRAVATAAQWR